MKCFFLPFLLLSCILNLQAQNGFQYQAVVRDTLGLPLSNQNVSLRFGIIQNDINNAPIYQEVHDLTTNAYGLIITEVGIGQVEVGQFDQINWQFRSFMEVEMDVSGGTNFEWMGRSELMPVPKALYAENAGNISNQQFGLYVTEFGAKGDNQTDDTDAFQATIDSAAVKGSTVFVPAGVYKITRTLVVPDGVTVRGEGMGAQPLQTPYNGSLIYYEGNGFALQINGHTSGLRDLTISDQSGEQAGGGIEVLANGRLVENVFCENILISGFVKGVALQMKAINSGGLYYSAMRNVRIRNAQTGIHIQEQSGGFVNSNSFFNGVISGGGFAHCLLVNGGNNNRFYGTAFETPASTASHILVIDGEIIGHDIRVEGNQQSASIPLIEFKPGTRNSMLSGIQSGGLLLDRGNNFINMPSGKSTHFGTAGTNHLLNAAFKNLDNESLPHWEIQGTAESVDVLPAELTNTHQVLRINVAAGQTVWLKPKNINWPSTSSLSTYDQLHFGCHVRTSTPDVVYTRTNAPAGVTISNKHNGSGMWQFIGMNALVNRTAPLDAKLAIENTSGQTAQVYITTPVLTFGNRMPSLDERPITTSGGSITGNLEIDGALSLGGSLEIPKNLTVNQDVQFGGVFTQKIETVSSLPANGFISLPRTANLFQITTTGPAIFRINQVTGDRFPVGTVITLLFDQANQPVVKSGYIQLTESFNSRAFSTLSLLSLGNGTWREFNRSK